MSDEDLLYMLHEVIEEIVDQPGRYETSYAQRLRYREARHRLRNVLIRLCAADKSPEGK